MSETSQPMTWGARWRREGTGGRAQFQLWAPGAASVDVCLEGRSPQRMGGTANGHWTAEIPCNAGDAYRFGITLLDGGRLSVPDPASRAQQGDVDDDSLVVDPECFEWQHRDWSGRPWEEAVIYELHIGALGGFQSATTRLPSLAALGVTVVELMPVSDFPGERNWGYDGVLPFAPDASYGSPSDLKRLIDTAHGLGLMVMLDVVYNHFGPDGNYLHAYAPAFFKRETATAWGGAIDFSQPEVRSFFTDNALYWLQEYRFDGLRIDAAHAIAEQDWLVEMAASVRAAIGLTRHVHLVLEHDGNAAGLLKSGFTAQWNDDAHHVLHVLLTGERDGYYRDYAEAPATALARCLAEGFIYQGEPSVHRNGEPRGEPSSDLKPTSFVMFLQNHDQIGNRAFGERLTTLADARALKVAQALQLLSPQIPLLFMGEESASTQPFLYFTSHRTPELAEAVRKGRMAEFAASAAFSDESRRGSIADPNDEETFKRSIPAAIGAHGETATAWIRELLALRRRFIIPNLGDCEALGALAIGHAAVVARWRLGALTLRMVVNLDGRPLSNLSGDIHLAPGKEAHVLLDTGGVAEAAASGMLPAHALLALLESP